VGGVLAVAVEAASSADMIDSTSSMQISTFSGFRSIHFRYVIRWRARMADDVQEKHTSMDNPTTPMHVIKAKQDLLCDLLDKVHGHTLMLMTLDQSQQILA
jgi:hypothetical protein